MATITLKTFEKGKDFLATLEACGQHSIVKVTTHVPGVNRMMIRMTAVKVPERILYRCDVEQTPPCKYSNNPIDAMSAGYWFQKTVKDAITVLQMEGLLVNEGEWTEKLLADTL